MKQVTIYTDGACSGNPGPGGWGVVLYYGEHRKEMSGGEPNTTNNRMELLAAISALQALKEPCEVELWTDSEYVQKGISEWIKKWRVNGWQTSKKEPVKNAELWQRLDSLTQTHQITWKWLKGHAGHPENERCDEIARAEIQKLKGQ